MNAAYLTLLKVRFLTLFQYRTAAFAGVCTQLFWGLINVMIVTAFYNQSPELSPITLRQAIDFIWFGQALLVLIPWNIDKELEAQVKNGNVAYELIRPIDLYGIWFCRSFAMRFVPTLLRAPFVLLVAALFFELSSPISFTAACAFALSLTISVFLASAITTLVIISLFWTISGEGIVRLIPHLVVLLSGIVVPLPFFPDWMQPFLSLQPFRFVLDLPIRLYTGVIPIDQAYLFLSLQLLWTLIAIFAGRSLMKRAVSRLTIQGG